MAVLLSEYPFSEGSGTSSADSSGNGHTLAASGTPWDVGTGHTGNGAHARMTSGDIGPNTNQPSWTVMAWVKVTTAPGAGTFRTIIGGGSPNDFFFEVSGASGSMAVDCYSGSSGEPTSAANLSTGVWFHAACVTAGVAAGQSQIYINGSASGSAGNANTTGVNFGAGTWDFAADPGGTPALSGIVDDVRIFSGALTGAEVAAWMNQPAGTGPPATALPVSVIVQRPSLVRASYY